MCSEMQATPNLRQHQHIIVQQESHVPPTSCTCASSGAWIRARTPTGFPVSLECSFATVTPSSAVDWTSEACSLCFCRMASSTWLCAQARVVTTNASSVACTEETHPLRNIHPPQQWTLTQAGYEIHLLPLWTPERIPSVPVHCITSV